MTTSTYLLPDGNTVVADADFIAAVYPDAKLVPVAQPQAPAQLARITCLAFRRRFTVTERTLLELSAIDDPAAPAAQRKEQAALRVYLADLGAASFVDLQDASTVAGVQALAQAGILSSDRAAEILTAPVLAEERQA